MTETGENDTFIAEVWLENVIDMPFMLKVLRSRRHFL